MLSRNNYGYIEFVECCREFDKTNVKDNEANLIYQVAKLDVLFDKIYTSDMHPENVIITKYNGLLTVIPIDSEVLSYRAIVKKMPITKYSDYMFKDEYKNNFNSQYDSNLNEQELFDLYNKQLEIVKNENNTNLTNDHEKRLFNAMSRIVIIDSQTLADHRENFLKDISKINEITDELFVLIINNLCDFQTEDFSEDEIKIIKNGIKNDLKSGRGCIPVFHYNNINGMYYNNTWFKNFKDLFALAK